MPSDSTISNSSFHEEIEDLRPTYITGTISSQFKFKAIPIKSRHALFKGYYFHYIIESDHYIVSKDCYQMIIIYSYVFVGVVVVVVVVLSFRLVVFIYYR